MSDSLGPFEYLGGFHGGYFGGVFVVFGEWLGGVWEGFLGDVLGVV